MRVYDALARTENVTEPKELSMEVRDVPIGSIRPYDNNPRDNSAAVGAVAESIERFGWQQPIVVDRDGVIVVGHTRYEAAKRLGLETVPVKVADGLSPEKVRAYRLADNKVGELATWDDGKLEAELDALGDELDGLDFDMSDFGFDAGDAGAPVPMTGREAVDGVVEDEPDESVEDFVKRGQVWRLGRHVLMCGDSTIAEDVDAAFDAAGTTAQCLLTDPPYNVAYEGGTEDRLRIENDSWDDDDRFVAFLRDACENAMRHLDAGRAFYIWYASMQSVNFFNAAKMAGMDVKQILVWAKNTFALGRQDYQWRHELCLYGWKDGAAHYFTPSRKESTVLEFDKPARNGEHPTMKPVALFAYQLCNSTVEGECVFDPFGGSGTTVVACEQTGRKAVTMELSEHYASVIARRWERLTGGKAELANR